MSSRPRLGINHIALEVADVEQALAFYGEIFDLELVDREPSMAFIEIADQSSRSLDAPAMRPMRCGISGSVDDKELVRAALRRAKVEILPGPRLDFRDPWGNRVQIVDYRDIQFTKAPPVLRGMGMDGLEKGPPAPAELRATGLL